MTPKRWSPNDGPQTMTPEHDGAVPQGARAVLLILGGLPGSGKTTLARLVARERSAMHLRVDTAEAALLSAGLEPGAAGYAVAYTLAEDNLRLGLSVVADSVNPLEATRRAWREVAARTGSSFLEVEIRCSDAAEHRRRVEARRARYRGGPWQPPTWQQARERSFEPWEGVYAILDTAGQSAETLAARLSALLERARHGRRS